MPPKLTNEIIDAAIFGFEQQKRRLDAQIADLRAIRDGVPAKDGAISAPVKAGRKKVSAATRRAMADGQRKRWAAAKGGDTGSEVRKPKRKLSAAGRASIVAALKKRWAAKKAAVKK
jgi:hypothetical protein